MSKHPVPVPPFRVEVGGLGVVYAGNSLLEAKKKHFAYRKKAKAMTALWPNSTVITTDSKGRVIWEYIAKTA